MVGDDKRIRLCRISAKDAAWVEERWKWLESTIGRDSICSAVVVRPTQEFFPDKHNGTLECSVQMLKRIAGYMGVDPDSVELSFYQNAPTVGFKGEVQAEGLYWSENGKLRIAVANSKLEDPLALAATLAHELAHVRLLGGQLVTEDTEDHEPLTELMTVATGMGVISSSSVIQESVEKNEYYTSWRISRSGYFSISLWGYALACFAEARGESNPDWTRDLRPDIRATFADAVKLRALRVATLEATGRIVDSNDDGFEEMYDPVSHLEFNKEPDVDAELESNSPDDLVTSMTAEELLTRYQSGQRNFQSIDFWGLELSGADFSGCNFAESDFSGCNLMNANLSDVNLSHASMRDADLSSANLEQANLTGTTFLNACLRDAILQRSRLRYTNFCAAKLDNADFRDCEYDRTSSFANANCDNAFAYDGLRRVMTGEESAVGKVAVFAFAMFWKICLAGILLFPIFLFVKDVLRNPFLRASLPFVLALVVVVVVGISVIVRRRIRSRSTGKEPSGIE